MHYRGFDYFLVEKDNQFEVSIPKLNLKTMIKSHMMAIIEAQVHIDKYHKERK